MQQSSSQYQRVSQSNSSYKFLNRLLLYKHDKNTLPIQSTYQQISEIENINKSNQIKSQKQGSKKEYQSQPQLQKQQSLYHRKISYLLESLDQIQLENLVDFFRHVKQQDLDKLNYDILLLAIILSPQTLDSQGLTWKIFYQILSQVLRIKIKEYSMRMYQFVILIQSGDQAILQGHKQAIQYLDKNKQLKKYKLALDNKSLERMFNSMLCLESLSVKQILNLTQIFLIQVSTQKYQKSQKSLMVINNNNKIQIHRIFDCTLKVRDRLYLQNPLDFTHYQIEQLIHLLIGTTAMHQFYKLFKELLQIQDISQNFQFKNSIKIQNNPPIEILELIFFILIKNNIIKNRKYYFLFLFQHIDIRKEKIYQQVTNQFVIQEDKQVALYMEKYLQIQCLKILTISKMKKLIKNIKITVQDIGQQEKMSSSEKLLRQEKIKTQIKRIKSLIGILQRMSQKFNDSSIQLIFDGSQQRQSKFFIQQMKEVKSLIVLIDLYPQRDQNMRIMTVTINKQHKYTLDMFVYPKIKTIEIKILYNNQPIICEKKTCWMGFQFFICLSLNKQQKEIGFSIDSTYYNIPHQKRDITANSICFGDFKGVLKDLYLLKIPLDVSTINKQLIDRRRKIGTLIESIGVKQVITQLKSGQKTIKNSAQKSTFWLFKSKQMKYDSINITKCRGLNFIDSLKQTGGIKSLVFLLQRVNYQSNNQPQAVSLIQDFFVFLKNVALAYNINTFIGHIDHCLHYFSEFLWLLIRRNESLARSPTLFTKVLDFLLFFKRDLKQNPLHYSQQIKAKLYKVQEDAIGKIILNFQLWLYCNSNVQQYILKHLMKLLQNKPSMNKSQQGQGKNHLVRYIQKDYLYQILIGIIFYFTPSQAISDKYQIFRQNSFKILNMLIEGYQLFQIDLMKNQIHISQVQIKSIVQRDIHCILTILYSLFYKRFWEHGPSQIATIQNICNFFQQNYMNNKKILGWVGSQHWPYIVFMLSKMIQISPKSNNTKVLFIIMRLIVKITSNMPNYNRLIYLFIRAITKRLNIDQFDTIFLFYVNFVKQISKIKNRCANNANQLFINALRQHLKSIKQISRFDQIQKAILNSQNNQTLVMPIILMNNSEFPALVKQMSKLHNVQKNQDKILPKLFNKIYSSQTYLGSYIYLLKSMIKNYKDQCFFQKESFIANHCLIQNGHSVSLLYFLIEKKIFVSSPKISINKLGTNSLQNDISGGTISHYLALNDLDYEQVEAICCYLGIIKPISKSMIEKSISSSSSLKNIEPQSIENITNEKDLVQFFMPYKLLAYILFIYYQSIGIKLNESDSSPKIRKLSKQINDIIDKKYLFIMFALGKKISYRILCCLKYFQKDLKEAYKQIKISNSQQQIQFKQKQLATKLKRQLQSFKDGDKQFDKMAQVFMTHLKNEDDIALSSFINKKIKDVFDILAIIDCSCAVFINPTRLLWKLKKQQYEKKSANNNIILSDLDKYLNKDIQNQKEKEKYTNNLKYIQQGEQIGYKQFFGKINQKFQKLIQKIQKDSHKNYQIWVELCKQNDFWIYQNGMKSQNAVYQIDLKQTGFYRLGIIQNKDRQPPYPRRKQFIENNKNMLSDIQQTLFTDKLVSKIVTSSLEVQQMKQRRDVQNTTIKNKIIGQNIDSNIKNQQFYAQYVTQKGVYAGIIKFSSDTVLSFNFIGHDNLPKTSNVYSFSTSKYHRLRQKINLEINLKGGQLFTRRYITRHTAVEIFNSKRSFFFNLFFESSVKDFVNSCKNKIQCIVDRIGQFKKRKITQKWQNNVISNFQYLMQINKFSGRTYNDLGQYYVFPWVLSQYTNKYTEVNREMIKKNLRNLSYPTGKLGQQKFKKAKDRLESVKDFYDQNTYFMYGTMYSNPTVLYNYFIRLEPFITLHWHHQSQKIDHADRLFYGIKQLWNSVLTNTGDMRQLTPQFYYWPQFLKNKNQIYLGNRQDKREVHDVALPGWAKNPQQFIFKMRQALQSPQVSQNLGNWIDLVFGYKSLLQNAQKYDNLFNVKAYESDIFQIKQLKGQEQQQQTNPKLIEEQIIRNQTIKSQYGQIPQALFFEQHPKRQKVKKLQPNASKGVAQQIKALDFSIQQQGIFCYTENQITIIKTFINGSSFKTQQIKKFETKGSISKIINMAQPIWFSINQQTLRIYKKKKQMCLIQLQSEAIQFYYPYVLYGNRSLLMIDIFQPEKCILQKKKVLYGHQNQINFIKVNKFLDLILTIDIDGLVLIHQLINFKFMRQFKIQFQENQCIICVEMHEMGYFIFITNLQNLYIFTYNGDLYLKQCIELGQGKSEKAEKITALKVLYQDSPILLISTTQGNIYQMDFLKVKRFNSIYPFKKYSRIKRQNSLFISQKAKKQLSPKLHTAKILNFYVIKAQSNSIPFYKIIVLYQTGDIIIFYEKENLESHLKKNSKLYQLGFF